MKIGTYYYPEQWPHEQWERDFDKMADMGLQLVHMAEFAWFQMEPEPGRFEFAWLDECIDMAAKRGMGVILCTPTAAPPIWLTQQHPEVLPKVEHGYSTRHGGRRHYSPTAPAMREATTRIVTAMGDHFGKNATIIGWQLDNEYGLGFDQSETTHAAFRRWLRDKYGSIERLNAAWGNQFWNQYYTSFDQILMPPTRTPRYDNPHHHLDASRFWSDTFARFNRLQADILKPRILPGQFITTNFMPFHQDIDPGATAGDLSLFAWDAYPVSGQGRAMKDETYRLADPARLGIVHDQMASYNGRWALLELQPGQVNWSGVPVLLYPGAVRLWIWTAFAHGAEFVTTYRFRQPRFGIEMFHHGLIGPDGVTESPGGRQFAQVVEEMERLDLSKVPPISESFDPKATVGLVLDFEQLWYYATLPQAKRWNQADFLVRWYAAVARLGLNVRILRPAEPWPQELPLIIAPGLQMVDDGLVKQFDQYLSRGGHLVLTCRTALMDRTGQLWEGPTAAPILPYIGGTIEAYDGLPDDTFGKVDMDGKEYAWGVWGDLLYTEDSTKVLARYDDQFYEGAAVITQCRACAEGTVTYCGVYGEQELHDALVQKLATQAGLATQDLPPRVHVYKRGPYRILLNYQDNAVDAPAPKRARFVVGTRKVEPAGVAIWEE